MTFSFRMPVFNVRIRVYVGEEVTKRLHSDSEAFAQTNGSTINVVFNKPNPTVGVIAHETGHAARQVLEWIGCKDDAHDEEVVAHIQEYIADKIQGKLK